MQELVELWNQSPSLVLLLLLTLLAALTIAGFIFLKNRDYRFRERDTLIEKGVSLDDYSLARKVPWQFWVSGTLLLILLLFSQIVDDTAAVVLLELVKVLTGAVIAALFGGEAMGEPGEKGGAEAPAT